MMQPTIVEYVVNALWQLPLLALGAWLFVRVVHPGPQTQHRLWLAILGVAVVLPACSTANLHGKFQRADGLKAEGAEQGLPPALPAVASPQEPQPRLRRLLQAGPHVHELRLTIKATHWLVGIYFSTIAFALLRVLHGWRTARQLVKLSTPVTLDRYRTSLAYYAQRFGVPLPQFRASSTLSSPVVAGAFAPVVLVPESFTQFTEEQITAVVCHELAHIKRHDYAVNLACQVAALPLVWHPAMHQIQQRIRMTREIVCDALAAEQMQSEISYARCLLTLAQTMLEGRTLAHPEHFPGLFNTHTLEERVMQLTKKQVKRARARFVRVTSGVVLMVASCAAAAMFHLTPTLAAPHTTDPMQTAANAQQPTTPAESAAPVAPATHSVVHSEWRQQKESAEKQERASAKITINREELRREVEKAQQQALEAQVEVNSPEFKKQIEEAQRQAMKAAAEFNSPEFKRQMEQAQQQAMKAAAQFNSPEFKRQMEQAQQQALKAKDLVNSPEFRKQMEDIRRMFRDGEVPVVPEVATPQVDAPALPQ
jgi:beta-lactamase regulating signal transducer with metallopeptidase domain